jgi:predicted HTH transcriptional regulator
MFPCGRFGRASLVEKILADAIVEHQLFDKKQGFHRLDDKRAFDNSALDKVCETLSAMANQGTGSVGHIIVGVSDKASDTERIRLLDKIAPVVYRGFDVVGMEREAALRNERPSEYWDWLVKKIRSNSDLDRRIADQVTNSAQLIEYRGRCVLILKVTSLHEANVFGDAIFERSGSENLKVPKRRGRIHARFQAPSLERLSNKSDPGSTTRRQ